MHSHDLLDPVTRKSKICSLVKKKMYVDYNFKCFNRVEDYSRSQAVTYAKQVLISPKQCKVTTDC